MNNVFDTQAAWGNRIPRAAWMLMAFIAICCNILVRYRARRTDRRMLLILPIAVSIAFFLISDIDSPRGGTIGVAPENLISLAQSLRTE